MKDFRFHVASLVAVFLALGVGIFIGYSISLELRIDPFKTQVAAVAKRNAVVMDENKTLLENNRELQSTGARLQAEVSQLADLAVVGRLSNRTAALVCVGSSPSNATIDLIWKALTLAGATRGTETVIYGSLIPPSTRIAAEILPRVHAAPDDDPAIAIGQSIAASIASGDDPTLPEALNHRGFPVDCSGTYGKRPDLVVLLSQVDSDERHKALERGTTVETTMVHAFQDSHLRVVACESGSDPESGASYFQRLGVGCVDNVDSPEGRVALVYAGLGYAQHYGTRQGADSLLPGVPRP